MAWWNKKSRGVAIRRSELIERLDKQADTPGIKFSVVQSSRAVNVIAGIFYDLGVESAQATVRLMIAEEKDRRDQTTP